MNNFLSNCSIKLRLSARVYLGIGLTLLLLLQSVASFAQKITLNYQNAPLEQVLREIRKQSGYDIFFDQNLVSQQPLVAVKITGANIEEAMATALKGLALSFTINGKAISIKKPDKAVAATRQQKITITGTIIDNNNTPLAGVSVSAANVKPVYTDGLGKFTLKDLEPLAMVRLAYTGKLTIERTALAISLMGEIMMDDASINLDGTIIQGQRMAGKSLGIKLDLKNRAQQSLSQVLEGTIPGLVIKTARTRTSVRVFVSDGTVAPAGQYTQQQLIEALKKKFAGTFAEQYAESIAISLMEDGVRTGNVTEQISDNTTILPELRGAGAFGTGNNAMLVIIDGFVQSDFPADYPMVNVLSVEVIRDPAETIKWGPRATNGVIIITTKGGQPGQLQITYNSTFSFSAAADNSNKAMQRASTSQLLDFYLEEDKLKTPIDRPGTIDNVVIQPAKLLLLQRAKNVITEQAFQDSWNLLLQRSNEQQYREQQQSPFNQTQNLNIAGGGKFHRFSLNGNYNTSRSEALSNSGRNWGLNFREQLSLLNNKLQIALQVNANARKNIAGTALKIDELDPYQMLYNPDGSYVYDYVIKVTNEYNNNRLKARYPGLKDYGYNPLEEARGTQRINKGHNLNSALNVDWKLLDGLTWSTNLQYTNELNNGQTLTSANTYYGRSLYNTYYAVGAPHPLFPDFLPPVDINPAVAYVPYGDVYQTNRIRNNSTNLRTGFSYSKIFDQKHALNLRVGYAYFNELNRINDNLPLYGYNSSTGIGATLSLPAEGTIFTDAKGAQINFGELSNVPPLFRKIGRNMSTNAAADYTYDQRLGLQAFYNESFMPVNSARIYSSTRNYNALASWALHKESFFKVPLISKLKISAGLGEIKMANLPVNLPAKRTFSKEWDTYFLEVTGYNPVRQNGEQIRNYDALLDLGLFKDVLQGQLNYRYNSMGVKNQLSGRVSYHVSKADYFDVPWISNLMLEGFVSNISPAQSLAQMMGTNSPLAGGGFSMATGNFDMGALPPHVINREVSLRFGLWKDRLTADARYYNRSNQGMANGAFQSDLSTGFAERSVYSRIDNKGYELYLQGKILQGDGFNWTSTVNAAYNINQAKDVLKPLYDNTAQYFSANRNGYATGSLWSLRWAGLDANGNPQVFDANGNKKVIIRENDINSPLFLKNPLEFADENWIEYSGRTTAPWSGAFIQEFGYRGLYARATLRFALGHVMRTYRPDTRWDNREKSSIIAQRWRQPGDEAKTDVPGIMKNGSVDYLRTFAARNSSNSIAPADFFRLSEIQFGYSVPDKWLQGKRVKSLNLTVNLQNVALWTRNKLGIDPEAIMSTGTLLPRQPMRYVIGLNVGL